MRKTAFLLGGTGKTGCVLARRLTETGWEVVVASRGNARPAADLPDAVRRVRLDRANGDALRRAFAGGVDTLFDFVAFEPEHAQQLLSLRDLTRSLVAVSSSSVYADAQGRSLDEAAEHGFPRLPVPIGERQRTVPPGPETYSTRKVAIERALLEQDALPATIVRPGAIYGPGDTSSREWHFVKRALDGRRYVLLAHRGESRFHPTSIHNLAELIRLAVERPGRRVVNCGGPDPTTVLEISRAIAGAMEHEWAEVLLDGRPREGDLGGTPWSVEKSFVLDMTEAEFEVGYRPVTRYEKAVGETCRWLVEATGNRDWREVLPAVARHYEDLFDYASEDEFVRSLAG